jgi:hypothetical protein
MLNLAVNHANSLNLSFNASKSFAICFGLPGIVPFLLFLKGNKVSWVSQTTYLGIVITSMLDDFPHVQKVVSDFYARFNCLYLKFKRLDLNVLCYLFDTYCTHYSGLITLSLYDNIASPVYTAWNKAMRRIFKLPYRTHVALLPQFLGKPHIKEVIHGRFLKFAHSNLRSINPIVRALSTYACTRHSTCFGNNLDMVLRRFDDITVNDFCHFDARKLRDICKLLHTVDYRDVWIVTFVNDLKLLIRDRTGDEGILHSIVHYLCCHQHH